METSFAFGKFLSDLLSEGQLAKSQAQGIHLVGPIIAQPGTEGFQQDAFQIDLEHRKATCPSGKQSLSFSTFFHDGSPIYHFRFGQQCLSCPVQPQCTQSKRGRTIAYDSYHPFVIQHRLFMQSEAFHQIMKSRPAVEGTISQLVRQGLRQAHYRGQRKVNLQAILLAVVVNLKRLFLFWRSGRQPGWAVVVG